MAGLLKTFGKGILYVIGLPFFLAALVLFGVFGLFAFVFQLLRSIIFFFTGQKFFPELPEDKQLRLLKEGPKEDNSSNEEANPVSPAPVEKESPVIYPYMEEPAAEEEPIPEEQILGRMASEETVEEACFGQSSEESDDEPSDNNDDDTTIEETNSDVSESSVEEAPIEEDEKEVEHEEVVVETSNDQDQEEEQEEELEIYVPESSNYDDNLFDDDNDDDGGVDIRFDV